jgi:hypothetical protein
MLASLDPYLPRMIPRTTPDLEMPHERVSPIRPPSGAVIGSPDDHAPDPESGIAQNPSDVAHETQGAMPAAAGVTAPQSSQITSSGNIISAHLTAFLNPESARGRQFTSIGQPGEDSGGQKSEWGLGSVAKLVSPNLVTAETSRATTGDSIPDGDARGPLSERRSLGDRIGSLLPHAAGLIAEVMPFDRSSLEDAVDQFFDQLEDLGAGQLAEAGPVQMLPLSLTVVGTVVVAEAARRRLRGKPGGGHDTRRRDPLGSEDLMGFPELPGSWSTRLT